LASGHPPALHFGAITGVAGQAGQVQMGANIQHPTFNERQLSGEIRRNPTIECLKVRAARAIMKLTQQTNLVIAGRDGADSSRGTGLLQIKDAEAFAGRSGQAHQIQRHSNRFNDFKPI
jgi:hypothetical protein